MQYLLGYRPSHGAYEKKCTGFESFSSNKYHKCSIQLKRFTQHLENATSASNQYHNLIPATGVTLKYVYTLNIVDVETISFAWKL